MKKLDKLILKSFLGPFIATFFITLFILVMQNLWKYIDDLVGKGLDFLTIGQFLWYASATLLTLAMPIAILISSIMTFGNLGESFELVAIKSAGISLLRFMRPLMWVAILLCGITFLFANYVIPYASLKFATLYNEIYYKKPAFDLKEGVFFTYIPEYAIKVAKKESDGKTIRNVLIYEKGNPLQDNAIVADKGIMQTSADKNFLEFNLENGVRYQERGNVGDSATEYIRLSFKEFKKLIDLSALKQQKPSEELFNKNQKMLSARQLTKNIDSLKKASDTTDKRMTDNLKAYMHYTNLNDSTWKKTGKALAIAQSDSLFPDSARNVLNDRALSIATDMANAIQFYGTDVKERDKSLNFHKLEWHRKYSFSMACLVLFFIGAPLGSIIRKGGLGMPLVVAIIFFLIFHLLNMFGEKFVREGIVSPFTGMWMAVMVLIPIGVFLTYKAMNDSQLFNKEFYHRSFRKIKPLFKRFSKSNTSQKI
ncbi:MAG: YjgP/YjgQ family permease [Sphingobacteriales bacterium]|nr:MAG: YjgP/YjgQ family permease [Sphingobacteriales bacterium]